MSEPENEPGTEPETPVEPGTEPVEPGQDEPDEDEAAEAGELDEPDQPEQPVEEPEPESLAPRSEKELEAAAKKMEKLREHVANRVGAILDEDANFLIPCPACGDEIPGFVWPPSAAPVAPEKVAALSVYIGLPDLSALKDAPDAQQCSDCGGKGEVLTHSFVPGFTTKQCSRCVGKGYTGTGTFVLPETGTGNGQQPEAPPPLQPVETGLPPEAQRLVDQGYMVVPPLQPTT